jgi:hypothetical protein
VVHKVLEQFFLILSDPILNLCTSKLISRVIRTLDFCAWWNGSMNDVRRTQRGRELRAFAKTFAEVLYVSGMRRRIRGGGGATTAEDTLEDTLEASVGGLRGTICRPSRP